MISFIVFLFLTWQNIPRVQTFAKHDIMNTELYRFNKCINLHNSYHSLFWFCNCLSESTQGGEQNGYFDYRRFGWTYFYFSGREGWLFLDQYIRTGYGSFIADTKYHLWIQIPQCKESVQKQCNEYVGTGHIYVTKANITAAEQI